MSATPSSDDERPSASPCPGSGAGTSLGALLRDARLRAGLSQRELAGRVRLSRATVAAAELGEDPRRSTLLRLLEALPALDARVVLLGPDAAPLASSPEAWELLRDVSGFSVRRVEHRLVADGPSKGRVQLVVEGVRPLSGDPRDPAVFGSLVRAVYRGEPRRLEEAMPLRLGRTELRLEILDRAAEHVLSFPADLESRGFRYERATSRSSPLLETRAERSLLHAPGYPVEELVLVAELEGRVRRPAGLRLDVRSVGLGGLRSARRLDAPHARVSWEPARREARAVVRRPLLHLAHELRWEEHDADVHADASSAEEGEELGTEGADLADVVRGARETAGLSRRGLAARMGTGVATVAGAEGGVDVRRSTLLAIARALPELRPEDLLPRSSASGVRRATRREAWSLARRAHGVVAEEERKRVDVHADGTATALYVTRRLTRTDAADEPLVVRYGSSPLGTETPAPELIESAGDSDPDDLRTKLVRLADGRLVHELSFSAASAERGVSYQRQVPLGRAFATVASEARGPLGPGVEGTTLAAAFCVRRLVVEVRWARPLVPRRVRAVAWPPLIVPVDGMPDVVGLLHPEGLDLRFERGRGIARLSVEEPLVGVRYALAWDVPG